MAQIGWIDFSPEHRERIAAVLDLLKPEGVVDELGVGSIRDAFSDKIFPGLSTIQTRAKYFFIIPYILCEYHLLPAASQKKRPLVKYFEDRENEVMWELADMYGHRDGSGVIGITKYRPERIMRRPSAIYWNGLFVFDFIRHGGLGVNSFLRSRVEGADSLISEISRAQGDDAPGDDKDANYDNRFSLNLPYDREWAKRLTLDLTRQEAELLFHRMREVGRGMLMGALLENASLFESFRVKESFADFARVAAVDNHLDSDIRGMITLAHDFSELMYGAHLAYNCQLQKNKFHRDAFLDEWKQWITGLSRSMIDYARFTPDAVLGQAHRVRSHTRQFVYDWWNLVRSASPSIKKRDELIEAQEFTTKLVKARIRRNDYEDVREGSWIGLTRLEYRMPRAKRIIQDVLDGKMRKK